MRAALTGRYEVEREQGRGGMASVFRARDIRHGRVVAVKVLHPELAEALGAERFLREVRITAGLSHPHILPLLDSGEADGLLYYVMPFVEGESLRDRIVREGPLPVPEALRITREVADALGHAHSLGIVHRDVKPENILLQGGHAMVADFGIARAIDHSTMQALTQTGTAIGTPVYMSPEQAHGEAGVDGRSDIYSLGCVAFEMLTGEPPYVGPTPMAITARKLTESVPPLRARRSTVSVATEVAITRALERTPADRFPTAHEFAESLGAPVVTGESAAATGAKRTTIIVGVTMLAIMLAAAGWFALRDGGRGATMMGSRDIASVAVLPFDNLSPDTAQAYFADGLTDEIITSLSMVDGVRVASRTSSTVLARQGLDIAVIGEKLGVETVVEGSVRAIGERIRISARLVKVPGGYPIWSETFDRTTNDALNIQQEIAGSIVESLKGKMVAGYVAAVNSGTSDPEAYDLYLQGRSMRSRQTEQTIMRSAEFFRAAIARAPDFARAHAGLSEVLAVEGFYEYAPPREVFPAAARAANEALRLDARLGSAHATRAYVSLYHDWNFARAEEEFRRAIAVEPNSAIAHQWYGNLLTVVQRFDEADVEFQRARTIDPAAPVRSAAPIWAKYFRRDFPRAVSMYRSVIALDSSYALTFQWGGWALEASGQVDEAIAAYERAVSLSNGGVGFMASLARAHAVRGDRVEAERLLAQVMRAPVVPSYDVAKVHLALGARAKALEWLERAYEFRSHSMVLLRVDSQLDALRGDPAFEALVKKVGL